MKILKLKSILFSLIIVLLTAYSITSNAQLTTNNGKVYFKNNLQRFQANGTNDLRYYSNDENKSFLSLYNNKNIRLGRLYGSTSATTGARFFGLTDADGNWSYLTKNDEYTAFRINDDNKMVIRSNGRVELTGIADATSEPLTGVLSIGGSLRLDGDEIITNKNLTLFINKDNNGDVQFDNGTLVVDASANKVAIGNVTSASNKYKLFVEKGILTEKVRVAVKTSGDWADYVFEEDYNLMPLDKLEDYITQNKHLPNVPSAKEVVNEGIDMAQMDATLLEKIEEAHLYIIELKKEIIELKENLK